MQDYSKEAARSVFDDVSETLGFSDVTDAVDTTCQDGQEKEDVENEVAFLNNMLFIRI